MDRLAGTDLGSVARAFLKRGDFQAALQACRADVAQYTIWHKSHTEPALRFGMPMGASLLDVDLRALADTVDLLLWCHVRTERLNEFPAALERLRENIHDVRWQRKIGYFHAICALGSEWNEEAGRRELSKLGSVAEDNDIEVLQLYLHLFGDTLTFSDKQALIDRILALCEELSDRLHYRGTKAVLYLTIGDQQRADVELSNSIDEVRSRYGTENLTEYERYRFAHSIQLLGMLRRDRSLLEEAVTLFDALLGLDHYWSPEGRANLLGLTAETHRHMGEWDSARQCYLKAREAKLLPIHEVFLCQCLVQLDQVEEAKATLAQVSPDDLTRAEQVDYAFTLAELAIESGERERLETAKRLLQGREPPAPLFRERRDAFLVNVMEAMASGTSRSLAQRTRRLLADITRSATSYLILKPSIMGVGIDIGKVLEDLSKRSASATQEKNNNDNRTSKIPKQ